MLPIEDYAYSPLNNAESEIRLLKIPMDIKLMFGLSNAAPLKGTMSIYQLPVSNLPMAQKLVRSARLNAFVALSYVWGDPTPSHDIVIDNMRLRISANLYAALRDIQKDITYDFYVWADAICIHQGDPLEKSAQILLMREIYHCASSVKIWLGPGSVEGQRCISFIAELTSGVGEEVGEDLKDTNIGIEEDSIRRRIGYGIAVGFMKPANLLRTGGWGFGQKVNEVGEILWPVAIDGRTEMILDRTGDFSLHQETIEKLVRWTPKARYLRRVKDEDFVRIAHSIDNLMIENSHWFERMWVVQEVCAAASADILFAGIGVELEDFLKAVSESRHLYQRPCHICFISRLLSRNLKLKLTDHEVPVRNFRKLMSLEKIRQAWNDGKRHPLLSLLRECQQRQATDPRDKIYSLLGLMGDTMSRYLEPDYKKSVSEVYTNASLHLITQTESLDPLCGWQFQGRREDLPSWVPDYSLQQGLLADPLVPLDGAGSIFGASGASTRGKFTLVVDGSREWKYLSTTGFLLDTIAYLSDSAPASESLGNIEKTWLHTMTTASEVLPRAYTKQEILAALGHASTVIGEYSDYHASIATMGYRMGNVDGETKMPGESSRTTPKASAPESDLPSSIMSTRAALQVSIVEPYISTLFCGRRSANERLLSSDLTTVLSHRFATHSSSPSAPDTDYLSKICKALSAGIRHRRLMISESGNLGAVSEAARKGDLICILFGCSVPIILRPSEGDRTEYTFIGECYFHGFMDAEALVLEKKGKLCVQEFELR